LARPKAGGPFPAIIVIHENRGLTEFVLDIAQRWATEGLLALAPDCLSRLGGTAKFESMDAARQGIGGLDRAGVVADLHATVRYLKSRDEVRKDKIGVSGFCWGGGQTFNFATESRELVFAVPFYGVAPALERLDRIQCPVFAVYAEGDTRVNANIEEVAARMEAAGKSYTRRVFPGTQHAFMNFTSPNRYNAEQARAAWAEVTAFVKKVVSG
ncbi:MAG TPA: dienelactone hydrolase family protein, partial [Verrucomicrobiae bacterium]|nr:dienelactone hydrolase family protein [Verrucomicrobiae bacterium]